MYHFIILLALLYNHDRSAVSADDSDVAHTTPTTELINFSCMMGTNLGKCNPKEEGNDRFEFKEIESVSECMTSDSYIGARALAELQRKSRTLGRKAEEKTFACASFFEWEKPLKPDLESDSYSTKYEELHFCFYDTPTNINAVIDDSSNGCKNTVSRLNQHVQETLCICYEGKDCNKNLKPKFKVPQDAKSLCGDKTLIVENPPEPAKSSNTAQSRINKLLLIITIPPLLYT